MTPWVEIEETRRRVDGDYEVTLAVRQTAGIPDGVFVCRVSDGAFSHVAVADEMDTTPATRERAIELTLPRYRANEFTHRVATPRVLGEFLAHVSTRLTELTRAYAGSSPLAEPGTRRYVVGGEEETDL